MQLIPPPSSLQSGSRVWAYLRDSGGPLQDRSIEQQRDEILTYCAKYGLDLPAENIFSDVHKSGGSTTKRDEFNRMIATSAYENLRPQGLLIWNFARFARDVDDSQLYKAILRKRGIVIHSLTDPIPEGPFAPLLETVVHIADEQKKREAAFGSWRGLRHIVNQGAVPGPAPRGIKRTLITVTSIQGKERQAHRWDPDPETRHLVLRAFEMRSAGASLGEIQKETHILGSINSYRTFFSNPIYKGTLQFGDMDIENYCEAIVPAELWARVQIIQGNFVHRRHVQGDSPRHPRRVNSHFLLSGIAKCARCGSPLYGHSSKQRNGSVLESYYCTRAYRKRDCSHHRIPRYSLEKAVLTKLHDYILDPAVQRKLLHLHVLEHAGLLTTQKLTRKELIGQLSKIHRQLSNVDAAIKAHGHSKTLLASLSALEAQEIELKTKIAKHDADAEKPVESLSPAELELRAKALQLTLDTGTEEQRRTVLRGMIKEIQVDRDPKYLFGQITFYLPPPGEQPNLPKVEGPDEKLYVYHQSPRDRLDIRTVFNLEAGLSRYTHTISFSIKIKQKPRSR